MNLKPGLKHICGLAMTLPLTASAQYSLDWYNVAGGGGTSTGGIYTVIGTIGQHDAGGPMTNGVYSVTGGFWAGVGVVQTPGAPLISVEQQPAIGSVRVFWPLPATGFLLEQSPSLIPPPVGPGWTPVPFPYQTNAVQISTTVTPAGNRFYRLRKL